MSYYVKSGQVSSGITLYDDGMYVSSGGEANSTTVKWSGYLRVSNGGVANDTTLNSCGSMYVSSGGVASYTTLNDWCRLYVFSGGVANETTVNFCGRLYVFSGGVANYTTLNNWGLMSVSSGGVANDTTVNDEGNLYVCGTANSTTVNNNGSMYVPSGGVANFTTVTGDDYGYGCLYVSNGGTANQTTLEWDGALYVSSGGVANSTTVNSDGRMYIDDGGMANSTTVNWGGNLWVSSGGTANSTTVNDGGRLYVSSGGKVTGKLTIAGAAVYVDNGGIIDFSLAGITPGAAARVNDLSRIQGTPNYYVTVSASQKSGTYTLAAGAADFNGTITVYAAKSKLGTITVGKTLTNGDCRYTLTKSSDKLSFKVVTNGPDAPTVKASTTAPTNQNVTLTATFSKDADKKQYSTDKKTWKTYSKAITVSANGTWYFRGVDKAGKASDVVTFKVTNIDKTAPTAPKLKASTTQATNQNVTITATFSTDSAKKQYSADNKTWKTYSKALSVGKNGTYYFRGVDEAGNVSKVASIKVANIDKTAPAAPTVKVSTTKVTNKSITVTATFSKDSAKKQYSTDNKTWKTYSKALAVKANGTYYFRGVDAAGNVSKVKSVKIANIVDTANNNWSGATVLKKTVLAALEAKADKVDYYNVSDVAKLMLDMEKGKAKVSFYDANKKAVKVSAVTMANGSVKKNVSALTLTTNNAATDKFTIAALDDAVKYLKIETADKTLDSYKLAKLA